MVDTCPEPCKDDKTYYQVLNEAKKELCRYLQLLNMTDAEICEYKNNGGWIQGMSGSSNVSCSDSDFHKNILSKY